MNADKSGTRTNGANSGSRASNWNNYPWNSNWNIGLRAACDDRQTRVEWSRPPTPTSVITVVSREALAVIQHGLKWFCEVRMGLVFSKWSICQIERGLDWLGYRIWPTHKLLRRRSVVAAKRKIARYRRVGDNLALSRFVASWRGHAQWANSFNLLNKLGVA